MNVTTKQTKKKQQSKSGKGTRTVNKTVEVPSFFGFFSPPYAEDKDMTEHIADQMQQDFSYGCIIKERLIPRAVAWYTGEAAHSYLALNVCACFRLSSPPVCTHAHTHTHPPLPYRTTCRTTTPRRTTLLGLAAPAASSRTASSSRWHRQQDSSIT